MTRLALLLTLSLGLSLPLQATAAETDCPVYGLEPAIPLVNPPAVLHDGFAVTSYFGKFLEATAAVLRFDDSGRLLWVRRLSGQTSQLDWISAAGDGTLLVAGSARTGLGSGTVIGKLMPDGSIAWSEFIHPIEARVWGLDGAPDGGGYVAMFGGVGNLPKTQIGLVSRFAKEGDFVWARTVAVDGDPVIQPVVASQSDGVLIAKTWNIAFDKRLAILLIKLTESGDLNWARLISSSDRDLGVSSLLTLTDGSFVIVGGAMGSGVEGSDSALIHFDKEGNPLSSKTLDAPLLGGLHLISRDTDGRFLLGGRFAKGGPTLADPVGPSQPTIARITLGGQIAWAKAEDLGVKGGMLFGLVRGKDHVVAITTRGDWGPSTLLRLTLDGDPSDGWNPATPVPIESKKLDLTAARTDVQLRPLHLEAITAGLSSSEAAAKLIPLCSQ